MKMVLAFFFITYSTLSNGADVSNFDIKGITLGATYDSIKSSIPCDNKEYEKIGNRQLLTFIKCGEGRSTSELLAFDHNKRINSVQTKRVFSVEPDIERIEAQLFSKYGKPDLKGYTQPGTKNPNKGHIRSYCWGACTIDRTNDGYWKGSTARGSTSGRSLVIKYNSFSKYGDSYDDYSIDFYLRDSSQHKTYMDWLYAEREKEKQIQKAKESDLDL